MFYCILLYCMVLYCVVLCYVVIFTISIYTIPITSNIYSFAFTVISCTIFIVSFIISKPAFAIPLTSNEIITFTQFYTLCSTTTTFTYRQGSITSIFKAAKITYFRIRTFLEDTFSNRDIC